MNWLWWPLAFLVLGLTAVRSMKVFPIAVIAMLIGFLLGANPAWPHDVYSDLHNPSTKGLCCNGRTNENGVATGDCEPTLAIAGHDSVRYWVRGQVWVTVPNEEVIFMAIPNEATASRPDIDPPEPGMVWGTFCGIPVQWSGPRVHAGWNVYCAFLGPNGS